MSVFRSEAGGTVKTSVLITNTTITLLHGSYGTWVKVHAPSADIHISTVNPATTADTHIAAGNTEYFKKDDAETLYALALGGTTDVFTTVGDIVDR